VACISAKAETIDRRGAFRDAFVHRRCVVPADGFYEWTGSKSSRRPIRFHREDGGLLLFAGLYESWFPEKNLPQMTFTIITCAPNAAIAPIHNRMPVVLDERATDDWMNPLERDLLSLKRLLVPAPDDALMASPASPLVNSVKNDGPELLAAPANLL
jgi:putative SOS response-associated peptidase YedK